MRVRAMVKPVLGAGAYAFNLTLAPLARGAAIPSGAWAELWVDGPAASLPSERRLSPSRLVRSDATGGRFFLSALSGLPLATGRG